tara:strand:- start:39627 stop:40862 length:1236 start_codon:yes stop_codon:yes gene_type:complete
MKVVITGMGLVSCLGNNVNQFWTNIKNGISGIDKISLVSPDHFPCKVSGEIKDFSIDHIVSNKESRRMARFTQYAIHATDQALKDSKLNINDYDPNRVGILMGVGSGGLPETDTQSEIKNNKGVMRMSPFYIPMMLPNMASANISRIWGITGYTNTCVTACAASTQSIGEAVEVIKRGVADIVITGGSEAGICELGMGGFSTMHALSTWEGNPKEASKPFDANRDGFAPSEGAGILIIESEKNALTRNANIYAEIIGWGVSSDAFHLVQPHNEGYGASLAMKNAIKYANISFSQVDYINAHGTSTPTNDRIETLAIKNVFKELSKEIPISSTKSMIGHSLGASGALEAIACIKTINDSIIHPTINYSEKDPNCDLDYVPNIKRKKKVDIALSNSFGFGGQNACLLLGKYSK